MTEPTLLERVRELPPALRAGALSAHIVVRLRESLRLDDDESPRVHARSRFVELGVGSKRALELKEDLEEALSLALPTTLFFDHPTPERLARHLDGLMQA